MNFFEKSDNFSLFLEMKPSKSFLLLWNSTHSYFIFVDSNLILVSSLNSCLLFFSVQEIFHTMLSFLHSFVIFENSACGLEKSYETVPIDAFCQCWLS